MGATPIAPPSWSTGPAGTPRQGSRGLAGPRYHRQVRRSRLDELWLSNVPIRPADIQLVSVLAATLSACDSAASWLSAATHKQRVHRNNDAHKHFYTELRAYFEVIGTASNPGYRQGRRRYASLRANLAAGSYGPPGSPRRTKVAAAPISFCHDAAQPFDQLGGFLAYKAQAAGVVFVHVDPAYTSQTCHACGWVDKRSRRSQAVFECGRCGFVGHADHNAAINIATRGVERWGEVTRPHAAPTLTAS